MVVKKKVLYVVTSDNWRHLPSQNIAKFAALTFPDIDFTFASSGDEDRIVTNHLILPFAGNYTSMDWPARAPTATQDLASLAGRASDFHALILQPDDELPGLIKSNTVLREFITEFVKDGKIIATWGGDNLDALAEATDPNTGHLIFQDTALASYKSLKARQIIYEEDQKTQATAIKLKDILSQMTELGKKLQKEVKADLGDPDDPLLVWVQGNSVTLAGLLAQKKQIQGVFTSEEKQLFDILKNGPPMNRSDEFKESSGLDQRMEEWTKEADYLQTLTFSKDMVSEDVFYDTLIDRAIVDRNIITDRKWPTSILPKLADALGMKALDYHISLLFTR